MFICCKITANFEHPVLYRIKYYISKSDILFLFSKSDTKISYPLNFPVMQAERSLRTYFFKKYGSENEISCAIYANRKKVFSSSTDRLSDCNGTRTHNPLLLVYELSGCRFQSCCNHLNFRYHTCLEQGVPWHSGNYRVWVHSLKPVRSMITT